jgi:hypothetical protein
MLAFRDKTLKAQGIPHAFDSDLKKFEQLKNDKKDVLSQLTTQPASSEMKASKVQRAENDKISGL